MPGAASDRWVEPGRAAWAHAASPREVIGGSRSDRETGVELPVDADIKAFADGAFMALFDEDGEQTDASAGRRGINVTVLDERAARCWRRPALTPRPMTTRARRWSTSWPGSRPGASCWSQAVATPPPT